MTPILGFEPDLCCTAAVCYGAPEPLPGRRTPNSVPKTASALAKGPTLEWRIVSVAWKIVALSATFRQIILRDFGHAMN